MDVKKISDNIKKYRELRGMTREFISDELGMSASGYSKIERGEVDLTISKLDKISQILGINVSQILNFDATNIFNVSHNNQIQGLKNSKIKNYTDDNTQKYIQLLEKENERLNNVLLEINKSTN